MNGTTICERDKRVVLLSSRALSTSNIALPGLGVQNALKIDVNVGVPLLVSVCTSALLFHAFLLLHI